MALIAHWKLEDPAGAKTVTDEVGTFSGVFSENNIVRGVNSPPVQASSMLFAGTDKVGDSSATVGTYPFSIALWLRVSSLVANVVAFCLTTAGAVDQHSLIRIDTVGAYTILNRNGAGAGNRQLATTTKTYIDSRWHNLIVVCASDSSRKIYVDGRLEAEDTNTQALAGNVTDWVIGAKNDNGVFSDEFTGSLASVRLYTHALTQLEINRLATPPTLRSRYLYGGRNLRNRYS